MKNIENLTRREWLISMGSTALATRGVLEAADQKSLRGAFMILATPYTETKAIDYEDLAIEVDFLNKCGVQGMVWPQHASDLHELKREERLRGMEVIARAAQGKQAALVLGVQAQNTESMLEYARHAERLDPDAVIAIPPTEAKSLEDYRDYFTELCKIAKRPVFIQTAGGAPEIEPTVEFIVEMGRKFSNFGYIKEEYLPRTTKSIDRMKAFLKYRPGPIKIIFGARRARAWTYEMRLGMDGTLTGGPMYGDVYAKIWNLHLEKRQEEVRDIFAKLLLMTTLEQQIPGVRSYLMKRRGVFKTAVSRRANYTFTADAIAEIEYNYKALKPYLKV